MQSINNKSKPTKLLKVPAELEQALFENPDATLAFLNLDVDGKNSVIKQVYSESNSEKRTKIAQEEVKKLLTKNLH